MTNILMPVRTVADWGGVHEWAMTAVEALVQSHVEVTVVGRAGLFEDRMRAAGAQFHQIEWNSWDQEIGLLSSLAPWDAIFSHGPLARDLAFAVGRRTDVPVHHMIHGAYLDQVNDWAPQAASIIAASPSVYDFVTRVGKVEPWRVTVVPNGCPDAVFALPLISLEEKLAGGAATVVTAARLAPDKVDQIVPTIALTRDLAEFYPEVEWTLEIMGDGPLKGRFLADFTAGLKGATNVTIKHLGWVEPDEVPRRMNNAVAACAAGMGGVRALAAGTLTLGVGAQGSVGIQHGSNLRAGLWSNFGDHGCPRFSPSDQSSDLKMILRAGTYDDVVRHARQSCRLHRSESSVRAAMFDALMIAS